MLPLKYLHHLAIICRDYPASKQFYTQVVGLTVVSEQYREDRNSYKLDLSLNGEYLLELFSFPDPPPRPTLPEAAGLRHLAFAVTDVEDCVERLDRMGVPVEDIRTDAKTGHKFTFFRDPDGLPLELYEG